MPRKKKKPGYMIRPRTRTARKRIDYVIADVFAEMSDIKEALAKKALRLKEGTEARNLADEIICAIDDVDQPLPPSALMSLPVAFEKRTKRLMTHVEKRDECVTQLEAIIERAHDERTAISEFISECADALKELQGLRL